MLIIPGSDPNGAVSTVSVMDVGTYAVPATPLIAPFPSFMTKGSGSTFSTFSRDNLQTCTPGYYARSLLPASTFGPLLGHQSYIPGSCNKYDFQVIFTLLDSFPFDASLYSSHHDRLA